MKNKEQQELCQLLAEFNKEQTAQNFQNLVNGLFRCPLLFPNKKEDGQRHFLLAEQGDRKFFSGFSDMEEASKGTIHDVEWTPYTLAEYCHIIAKSSEQGLIINIFDKKHCVINREFFKDVICPAFAENRVMPALKAMENQEYIPVSKMPFTIGRNEQADLTIPRQTINDLHAQLLEKDGKYYVVDKDSLNGVFVNGKEAPKNEPVEIEFDDVLEFCDVEYTFTVMGLADRKPAGRTIYGEEGFMIANGLFFAQNRVLMKEFYDNTDRLVAEMEKEDNQETFRRYFLIGVEMTCAIREREMKITDEQLIKEQRQRMLQISMGIFQDAEYGFSFIEHEAYRIYVAEYPQTFQGPGLARRVFLLVNDAGEKMVYAVRMNKEKKAVLVKVEGVNKETECGEISLEKEEELKKILELGI